MLVPFAELSGHKQMAKTSSLGGTSGPSLLSKSAIGAALVGSAPERLTPVRLTQSATDAMAVPRLVSPRARPALKLALAQPRGSQEFGERDRSPKTSPRGLDSEQRSPKGERCGLCGAYETQVETAFCMQGASWSRAAASRADAEHDRVSKCDLTGSNSAAPHSPRSGLHVSDRVWHVLPSPSA